MSKKTDDNKTASRRPNSASKRRVTSASKASKPVIASAGLPLQDLQSDILLSGIGKGDGHLLNEDAPQKKVLLPQSAERTPYSEASLAGMMGRNPGLGMEENVVDYPVVFQHMPFAFALSEVIFDPTGQSCDYRYLDVNKAYEKLSGVSREKILQKTALEHNPGLERSWLQKFGRVSTTGDPLRFEHYLPRQGRWFEVYVYSPRPGQFASIITDIADRKPVETGKAYPVLQPEDAKGKSDPASFSRESTGLYGAGLGKSVREGIFSSLGGLSRAAREDARTSSVEAEPKQERRPSASGVDAVFDHINDGFILLDAAGNVVSINDAFVHFHKFRTREDFLKSFKSFPALFEVATLDGKPVAAEEWVTARALRGEGGSNAEFVITRRDAAKRWFASYNFAPVRNEQGQVSGAVVTMRNITRLKEAEEALRKSEAKYREVVESGNTVILRWDRNGKILFMNPFGQKLFGCSENDVLGKTAARFLTPAETWTQSLEGLIESINRHPESNSIVTEIVRKNGERVWVFWANKAFLDRDGEVSEILSIGNDITAQKRAEENLRQSEERFRISLHGLPITVATLDRSLRYTWVYNTRDSLDQEQMLGRRADELLLPGDARDIIALQKQVLETGAGSRREIRGTTDGNEWFFDATAEPLRDSRGAVVGLTWVAVDITNRKRAEEFHSRSEERFRLIAEAARVMVVDVELGTGKVLVVRGMQELTGYDPDRVVFTRSWWLERMHPDDRPAFEETMKEVQESGRDYSIEYRILNKQDAYLSVQDTGRVVRDASGRIVRIIAGIRNVTERKRSEQAMRESKELYQTLAESGPLLVWSSDRDGHADFVNSRWQQYTGLVLEQLNERGWESVNHPEDSAAFITAWRRASRKGESFEGEFRHRRHDGEYRWFWCQVVPVKDGSGTIVKWIGISNDITERKQTEEALRQNQDQLREYVKLLEYAPVMVRNMNNEIILWNSGMERIYGYTSAEAIGQKPHLLLKTESTASAQQIMAVLESEGKWEGELNRITRDGRNIIVTSLWILHKNVDGRTSAVIEINSDITERRRAEEELQAAHAELERRAAELDAVNRELDAFSYTVSHDLKAPLWSIEGFTRALLEDYAEKLDATGRDYLKRVNAASKRMTQLIEAMLNMARLTMGEVHENFVDLGALAHVILQELRKQDPDRRADVIIGEKMRVRGDMAMLQVMLQNLLANAWKFTGKRAKTVIEFSCTEMGGQKVFFIRDNGAGFDMQYADKMFMPFKRFHTQSEFPGVGIGLATAHRIITRHNGRIWAESKPDQGATFYFTL